MTDSRDLIISTGPSSAPQRSGERGLFSRARLGLGRRRRLSSEKGFPIVLTADRTLMANYQVLFDGMMSASQTTRTPGLLMKGLLAPSVSSSELRAQQAPLGLRRIEAALTRDGWGAEDVAVVCPEELSLAIGPETRIVGISSGDPLGRGMNSSTMTGIAGGEIYTSKWLRMLSEKIGLLRRRAPQSRIVMGGPGAWQLSQDDDARRALGIDHVIMGYCEGNVADIFCQVSNGDALPPVLKAMGAHADSVPAIKGPTVMGNIEISRGCGLGCDFCTIGQVPMTHFPVESILADIETNLTAGVKNVSLITEDVFRYGATGGRIKPEALIQLLREIHALPGLRLIQTDHANVASLAQFADEELEELRRLFVGESQQHEYIWLNLGVETASGELLAANGGRSKMRPFQPEEWGEACLEQVRRLVKTGFFPLVSLLMGLPGETQRDVDETARWVAQLRDERLAVFPLFYAPIDGQGRPFGVQDMSSSHWRLFSECYRLNFKWIPKLLWDNQAGAGVALWRRILLQTLGRGQVLWWKGLFIWRSGRLFV